MLVQGWFIIKIHVKTTFMTLVKIIILAPLSKKKNSWKLIFFTIFVMLIVFVWHVLVHFFCQARKLKLLLKERGEFQPGIGGSVTAKKLRNWQERRGWSLSRDLLTVQKFQSCAHSHARQSLPLDLHSIRDSCDRAVSDGGRIIVQQMENFIK